MPALGEDSVDDGVHGEGDCDCDGDDDGQGNGEYWDRDDDDFEREVEAEVERMRREAAEDQAGGGPRADDGGTESTVDLIDIGAERHESFGDALRKVTAFKEAEDNAVVVVGGGGGGGGGADKKRGGKGSDDGSMHSRNGPGANAKNQGGGEGVVGVLFDANALLDDDSDDGEGGAKEEEDRGIDLGSSEFSSGSGMVGAPFSRGSNVEEAVVAASRKRMTEGEERGSEDARGVAGRSGRGGLMGGLSLIRNSISILREDLGEEAQELSAKSKGGRRGFFSGFSRA